MFIPFGIFELKARGKTKNSVDEQQQRMKKKRRTWERKHRGTIIQAFTSYKTEYVISHEVVRWRITSMQNMRQLLGTDNHAHLFTHVIGRLKQTFLPVIHTNIHSNAYNLWYSNSIISKCTSMKLNCSQNGKHINYNMHISFDLLHIAFVDL